MTEIVFAAILTAMTGAFAIVIWLLLECLLQKYGQYRLLVIFCWLILFFHAVPVVYLVLRIRMESSVSSQVLLLDSTRRVEDVIRAVGSLLLSVSVMKLFHLVLHTININQQKYDCEFVDREVSDLYRSLCRRYHLKPVKELMMMSRYSSPGLIGLIRVVMLLPPKEKLTQKDYRVIITHELVHHRNWDNQLHWLIWLLHCFYWWDPLIIILYKKAIHWIEYVCDDQTRRILYPRRNGDRLYFKTIDKLRILELLERARDRGLFSSLLNEIVNLEERKEQMRKGRKCKHMNKSLAIALMTAALLAGNVVCVFAAEGMLKVYNQVYWATVNYENESIAASDGVDGADLKTTVLEQVEETEPLVEYTESAGEQDPSIIVEEHKSLTRSGGLDWTIPSGYRFDTDSFTATEGQGIKIVVSISPNNLIPHIGIREPDGDLRYVAGIGTYSHTFEVRETGSYRVFARNVTSETVRIIGGYALVD